MKLNEYILKKPVVANLLSIMIVVMGVMTLFNLKRATYPQVDFDIIKITTVYPGAAAEDVEINVTNKIEDELKELDGIDEILSSSLENLSLIYVFVDPDASNIDRVKDDISRAVDRVNELPDEVDEKPEIQELKSSNVAVIELAISGDTDEATLRKIAKDLESEIKEIDGTGRVEKVAYRKREVKILSSSEKLKENYVALHDIIQSIRSRNVRVSGGNLKSYTSEKKIITFAEFEDPMDVSQVIIRSNFSGKQIALSELAEIENTFEDPTIIARTNGKPSINLLIRSQASADIIDISEDIKELVKNYSANLKDNIKITVVSDFSRYTSSLLNIVKNNAIIGFFLVIGALLIFLNKYTAFWTAVGISLSILGSLIFFPVFGININFISLITMIIVLGLLVDDAIVIAENITRHREEGLSAYDSAVIGVREVFWPVLTTIITTILAFVSLFFVSGVMGKFIWQIPAVVILTLGMSLFEAIFILPVHIAHSPLSDKRNLKWFDKFKEFYENTLRRAIKHRIKTLFIFVAFLIFSIGLGYTTVGFNMFPYDDVDLFYVIAELPSGASHDQTTDKLKDVEKIISDLKANEIQGFTTRIGHHDTDVYGASAGLHDNWGMIAIYLKPSQERERRSEELISEIEKQIKNLNGFEKLYLQKFYDGPPVGKPITVTVVSDNDELRRKTSQKIFKTLEGQKGVFNLSSDDKIGKEEIQLRPDFEAMARYGITADALANTIRAAFEGVIVTDLTREGEEIDFRVQLVEEERRKIDVLETLQVPNQTGRLIPISEFTKMKKSRSYELIKHYNGRRSITIEGDVDEVHMTSAKANKIIKDKFSKEIEKTPGLRLVFGGQEKATQESLQSFGLAFICALLAIYAVLVILFESFAQPFIVLSALLFGLGGNLIVFSLHGLPISFMGIIGSLGLLGIVVNDSLIIVTHLNDLREKNEKLSLQIIIDGAKTRLRPVILTTVTTVAGLLPTIYGFGGYEPFVVPLVLAVAGGLIFATFITLILVPTIYSFQLKE